MCQFCRIKYDPLKECDWEKERRCAVTPYRWTSLERGVDKEGKIFMIAVGDDESAYYYPEFCPDCGRKL